MIKSFIQPAPVHKLGNEIQLQGCTTLTVTQVKFTLLSDRHSRGLDLPSN